MRVAAAARHACLCRGSAHFSLRAAYSQRLSPAPPAPALQSPLDAPAPRPVPALLAEMQSSVALVERELLQGGRDALPPSAHSSLLEMAAVKPVLLRQSCPDVRTLSPQASGALERALECWGAVQDCSAPQAARTAAASLAVRAYGLIGAHRLALALFRTLQGGRGVALQREALLSCLHSAKLVGDSTAYLEVLEALEALAPAAAAAAAGAPAPLQQQQQQPHEAEARRLEGLLEAIVRGSGEEVRAASVLTALHALHWPLSLSLFSLQAHAALARGRVAAAAAAMRELVRVQRTLGALPAPGSPELASEMRLAGSIVRRALKAGMPEAACMALLALRQMVAGEGSPISSLSGHIDLEWALRTSSSLGCVPLVEALAADALRHAPTRDHIWAGIAKDSQDAGAAPPDVRAAAVHVRVLCYLAEASALSGDDTLGALRAVALADLHSAPHVRLQQMALALAGTARLSELHSPSALAPLPTTHALVTTALRKVTASFFGWETKLEREAGAQDAALGQPPGDHALAAAQEAQEGGAAEAGWGVHAASEGEGAGAMGEAGSGQAEALLQGEQGWHAADSGEAAPHAPPAPQADAEAPPAMPVYVSMACLMGLSPARYPQLSLPQLLLQQEPQQLQHEVLELKALAGGYALLSFQARLLGLASAQACMLYEVGGRGGTAAAAAAAAAAGPAGSKQQDSSSLLWLEPQPADKGRLGGASAPARSAVPPWVRALAENVDRGMARCTEPLPSEDPAAALPGVGGSLPPSLLRSLSLTQHLARENEADDVTAPLPEGNLRLVETLRQSLKVQGSPGRSAGGSGQDGKDWAIAFVSPSALKAVLGALASNTRTRPQCVRILDNALDRFGCHYLPMDAIACAIESIVTSGTMESRIEAFAAAQMNEGGGSPRQRRAGRKLHPGARVYPIDMDLVGNLLRLVGERGAIPSGCIYSAVSHACLKRGSSALAAAALRQALALGCRPPEVAFQRLLREAVSLHEAGLCPMHTEHDESAAGKPPAAPGADAFRYVSLLSISEASDRDTSTVKSVQEAVELLEQAGACVCVCIPPSPSLSFFFSCSSKGVPVTALTTGTWTSVLPSRAAEHTATPRANA